MSLSWAKNIFMPANIDSIGILVLDWNAESFCYKEEINTEKCISYSIQKTSPPFGPSRKSSASITSSSSTNSLMSIKHNL